MASIDRYRPAREGYQPPSLPQTKPGVPATGATAPASAPLIPPSTADRLSHSPSSTRRRDVPPAVPSPPTHSSRTSPPRPMSRKDVVSPAAASPLKTPAKTQERRSDLPPFASQWFFTEEEAVSTPSVLDGLSPLEERERRAKGVNFIYQSGIAVQPTSLPQVTLYVAAVFFHRFYMRISMVEDRGGIHHYKIAATALFLANKTEENCFKTKNIIIAVAKIAQKNFDLIVDEQSKEYWRWRDCILTYEELMLETLTFDLMVANPYDRLWEQLQRLDQLGCKPVREAAWTFLNDSALTALPLLLDASDIASASIFFASVASGEKLDDVEGRAWWQFLRADERRITRAIHMMVAFYTENPLKKQNGRIQGSPVFSLETTRRPHELSQLNSSRYLDSGSAGGAPTSRDVTPLELDRQAQSQPVTTTTAVTTATTAAGDDEKNNNAASQASAASDAAVFSQAVSGDSDAVLKAAANDLDRHPSHYNGVGSKANGAQNGHALPSPGRKRKSAEPDDRNDEDDNMEEGEYSEPPPPKRARQSGHDER